MKRSTSLNQQQKNHRADALNNNRGTSGTNITNAHVHGNRGEQMKQRQANPARPQTHGATPSKARNK